MLFVLILSVFTQEQSMGFRGKIAEIFIKIRSFVIPYMD